MRTGKIGITPARGMGPLPVVLERIAGPRAVQRVFSRVGVPLEVTENTGHSIPMLQMIGLFHHAGLEAGDSHFGMRVGMEMEPGEYGNWTRYAAQASTLKDGILRLRRTIWAQQNVGRMELGRDTAGAHVIWSYMPAVWNPAFERQHADHVVPVMIRFARTYLGADWEPAFIRSSYHGDRDAVRPPGSISCDWTFGGEGVSLAFEPEQMKATRRFDAPAPLTSVDLYTEVTAARTGDPLAEINALIATRLLAGQVDIDGLAAFSGLSKRTLQRRLDARGTTYRQALDRMRHQKAVALLRETESPVTDIALSLGYSDIAHFTRAFRRWSGQPPSALRGAELASS